MVKALETPQQNTPPSAAEGAYTVPSEGQLQDQRHDGVSGISQPPPAVHGFNLRPVAGILAWGAAISDQKDIQLKVQKGFVTLSGEVDWHFQRCGGREFSSRIIWCDWYRQSAQDPRPG